MKVANYDASHLCVVLDVQARSDSYLIDFAFLKHPRSGLPIVVTEYGSPVGARLNIGQANDEDKVAHISVAVVSTTVAYRRYPMLWGDLSRRTSRPLPYLQAKTLIGWTSTESDGRWLTTAR